VQTRRIPAFPLIMFGSEYWSGLNTWFRKTMLAEKYISPGDTDLLTVTDKEEEAIEIILDYRRRIGVPDKVPKAFA
jgi:predicted Rossmann-fold nucleotide-binding protein